MGRNTFARDGLNPHYISEELPKYAQDGIRDSYYRKQATLEAIERRQKRRHDRKTRIKIIEHRDHETNKRLLYENNPVFYRNPKNLASIEYLLNVPARPVPWQGMDEEWDNDMSNFATLLLADMNKDSHFVEQQSKNNWLPKEFRTTPTDYLQVENLSYQTQTLYHVLYGDSDLPVDKAEPAQNKTRRLWNVVDMAFKLIDKLCMRGRFLDSRYHNQTSQPLPDGTNIEHIDLRLSWLLHRLWIRLLHYRPLYQGDDPIGIQQIDNVRGMSLALLRNELDWVSLQNGRQIPLEFDKFFKISNDITEALGRVGQDIYTETRPQPSDEVWNQGDTVRYNLEDHRMEGIISKHFRGLDKTWMLWAYLICDADDFEDRMLTEHVEDVLIEKRVVLHDEPWTLARYLYEKYREPNRKLPELSDLLPTQETDKVLAKIRRIGEVNRTRRNYLLLTDWCNKRPWKQLYRVFDTAPGEQDYLLQPIIDFYADITRLDACEPSDPSHFSPSKKSNVWSHLFTFHPITTGPAPTQTENGDYVPDSQGLSSSPPSDRRIAIPSNIEASSYNSGCAICMEDFNAPDLIAQLHCNHLFHYKCIRTFWDNFGVIQFLCPICRKDSVMWELHETCGITPEVRDVWDLEEIMGPEYYAETGGSIDSEYGPYWLREKCYEIMSRGWPENQPRDVATEMYHLRSLRRERNAQRRKMIAQMYPDKVIGGFGGLEAVASRGE